MHRISKKAPGVLAAAVIAASLSPLAAAADPGEYFEREATYPVYQNHPDGAAAATAAEISTVSADGNTLIYSDALSRSVGFLDISNPAAPKGLGLLGLHQLGSAEDEPTSVAAHGDYVFVVVNTSASYSDPSGRVDVVRIADRTLVHSFALPGQPDSIALSADGAYAGIAIENERDEDAGEGALPQAPAGTIAIMDLQSADPAGWKLREVPLTSGSRTEPIALPLLAAAGLDTPQDPEPEYVTINEKNQLAATLQENNGVVLVDLASGGITGAFSTGTVDLAGIDTEKDGVLDPSGELKGVPREPDAIGWIQDRYLATANEGDWKGGSRGFTIFDSATGDVVWDAGNSFEHLALSQGLFPEQRAGKKGVEPEGLAIAEFGGVDYGFIAAERGNFVAVYDLSEPSSPRYLQSLPTTNGPEGILPIPGRNLLAIASETDEGQVRSAVSLYSFGAAAPQFPQLSSDAADPVPFGALSGLSANPADASQLFAVSDNAYQPRIYTLETGTPATVESSMAVTSASVDLDLEGIAARADGGFWAAHEGETGADNLLVRIDAAGAVQEEIALPALSGLGKHGLEGIAATGSGKQEEVVFAVQRELPGEDVVRLGKYLPSTGEFSWYGYQLDPAAEGAWHGLSEITALPDGSYAVIERDNQVGPDAKHKAVYQFRLPQAQAGEVPLVQKKLAADVLPVLQETSGWTQEKLEGLAVADGQVYVVTDNDAVDEATGETVFANLGAVEEVFELAGQAPSDAPGEEQGEDQGEELAAEPTRNPSPQPSGESHDPSQVPDPTREAGQSQAPQAADPAQPEASEHLADTGANSFWLIPVGAVIALLGAAAALKTARARAK
ncbi:esterase-like activity of phytase family protein [Glutamicibacter sp. NPDC087673]|uniref:esterase-like activity of phytase family protein n=1 Tax=Glutamicibacter sp. NPDC087673 TaxID=3363997 RepID=UPI00380A6F28